MGFEQDRFGSEQVQAPETVLRMPKQGEPRRPAVSTFGSVVCCQNPADHIFIDVEAKDLGQVLGDLRAAKAGIAPIEFTDLWRSAKLTLWVAETPSGLKCDTWFELDGVSPEKLSPQQKTGGSDSNPKCLPSRADRMIQGLPRRISRWLLRPQAASRR